MTLEAFLGLLLLGVVVYAARALVLINRATFWPEVDDIGEFTVRQEAFGRLNEEHRPL